MRISCLVLNLANGSSEWCQKHCSTQLENCLIHCSGDQERRLILKASWLMIYDSWIMTHHTVSMKWVLIRIVSEIAIAIFQNVNRIVIWINFWFSVELTFQPMKPMESLMKLLNSKTFNIIITKSIWKEFKNTIDVLYDRFAIIATIIVLQPRSSPIGILTDRLRSVLMNSK